MSKFPILYKGDATDFFTLGLGPIQMLKATVIQERNGIFIFEGEILTDNPLFPLVLENYLIKADADHLLKDQRFRIKRIVPNHNGKAEIYAEHVSYLSRELTIKPEVSITGSAQVALSQWKASIVESNPFVVDSDIPTSNKTKWRIDKVENPRMALGGVEGSILDVWGGEYRFDNYHISLLQKRGTTAKTVLAYGRNITDFEQERNIANTYTSIAPYAIYTDDKENEVVVHVDGYVVDSQHINKYPNRVTLPVDFSSEFGHDEVPTKARLLALANQYIKANEIGVPSTSIKVSFVDLSKSADYAEYAFLEQVNLCDDVRIYYPKLGVNTVAKVIRTVWNVLTESYDEIEIGQKRMSLVGQMQEQQKAIKEINTQTNYAMTSADGKNTIFHGLYGENGLGEPTATKVGDTWFKPNGTGTDILTWTGTVWQLVFDAKTFDDIGIKVDEMEQEVQTAIDQSQTAINNANQAVADAGFAKNQSATALSQAGQAVADANTAITDAQSALDAYRNMEIGGRNLVVRSGYPDGKIPPFSSLGTLDRGTHIMPDGELVYRVKNIHDTRQGGIYLHKNVFTTPIKKGDLWTATFEVKGAGKWTSLNMEQSSNTTNDDISEIPSEWKKITFTGVSTSDSGAFIWYVTPDSEYFIRKIKVSKGNKATDWSPAPEDVQVQISDINGELSRKVSQQTFDTLQGTVNTQSTQINQNKADIQARATKTEVNTLTGTVNSLDSQLKLEAGKISALNSKTDGHTTEIGSLQSGFSGLNSTVAEVQSDLSKKVTDLQYRTSSTSGSDSGKWTKFASSTIFVRYHDAGAGFDIVSSGTGDGETYTGEIYIRHKQQDVMGGSVLVTISLLNSSRPDRLSKDDIAAVVTINDGIKVTIDYYIRVRLSYASYNITPFNKIGDGQLHYHATQPYLAELPQGLELNPIRAKEQGTLGITTTQQIKFATFEQTVNGFMTTVQNEKADRSEVTQLAGQWSATVAKVDGHTGQITNLGNQINLRVEKDKLISQINLSTEGVLIQGKNIWLDGNTKINDAVIKTAHIADLAVSGAKIANASISSAKIISLDASKITANTLSAITTNTGALNVSGNLTMTTDNTRIIGSFAYGETASSAYNPRYFEGDSSFGRRFISFTGNVYNATTSGGKGTHRYYSESFFGHDYFKLRAYSSNGGALLSRVDGNGLGIEIGDTWGAPKITLTNGAVTAQRLYGGRLDTGPSFNTIIIGEVGNIASMQFATSNIYFNHLRNDLADFRIGVDGAGRVVQSLAVYNRTYSSSANMHITDAGTFGRSVSARKYKTDIQSEYLSKAKNILQISPSSWHDKEALRKGKEPKRYYGFIADEFHELGLTEVVQYGADGQVEGLAYDRISMYHNVILAGHERRFNEIDGKLAQIKGTHANDIWQLKAEIQELKNEIQALRQSA